VKPELEHIAVTSELLDASGQIKWHNYLNYFIFTRPSRFGMLFTPAG
jgi:hypothetical protein